MQKQFVTYEIALKLKELGFDELCFAYFNGDKELRLSIPADNGKFIPRFYINANAPTWLVSLFHPKKKINICTAPLWQQVIDWFREEHRIHVSLPNYYKGWKIDVRNFTNDTAYNSENGVCLEDYYATREQAILKALELINK